MAPRAFPFLLATPLLAGVAALRSRQPTELAAEATADLDERADLDDAPLELEWEVSRLVEKLRPPRQSGSFALQRSTSALGGGGRSPDSWIFGSHHKAGTDLLRAVAMVQTRTLGLAGCMSAGKYGWMSLGKYGLTPDNCQERHKEFNVYFDCGLSVKRARGGFGQRDLGRNYRVVHIMRDPLAMVVSGYIFHSSSDDTPEVLKRERNQSMVDGLSTESSFVMTQSGKEMIETYQATRHDPRVLHVRFEDFTRSPEDFDHMSRRIYNFTVGDLPAGRLSMEEMVAAISAEDLNRHPPKHPKHVASRADEETVRAALQKIDPKVMDALEEARAALGY